MSTAGHLFACLVLLSCVAMPRHAVGQPTFQGLGVPAGFTATITNDVSADGTVVAGTAHTSSPFGERGFRWTAAGELVLYPPGPQAFSTTVHAVSPDGGWVVGQNGADAYAWPAAGPGRNLGIYGAPPFLPGHSYGAVGRATSEDGSVVVGHSNSHLGLHAFRWTAAAGMRSLGYLSDGDTAAFARDVSADGTVVVGEVAAGPGDARRAFRWTEQGGMKPLGFADGVTSFAAAISHDGSTIVGQTGAGAAARAFRWTVGEGPVDIGGATATSSAGDVSADGSVVVGEADGQAFVWDAARGLRPLRQALIDAGVGGMLEGWTLSSATGVSADGLTIVGRGINPAGQVEGWVATLPVPEPTGAAPLLAGSALLLRRSGRRRRGCGSASRGSPAPVDPAGRRRGRRR